MRIVVMGVSGCGKTSAGKALAAALGLGFVDADDLHPAANRRKMAAGHPLNDDDRQPWLDAVAAALRTHDGLVVACSALRRCYRDRLRAGAAAPLRFFFLTAPDEVIAERLAGRQGHFMPASLLHSQLATLEPPGADEADPVSVDQPLEAVLRDMLARLNP